MAVPPVPVRDPSQRPLAPSFASTTSVVNDKHDNEMIPGVVHRSPGICLTAEENPKKPQVGNHHMKGQCNQSSPKMGSISFK
jgi:hypothetical protein